VKVFVLSVVSKKSILLAVIFPSLFVLYGEKKPASHIIKKI